MKIASASQFNFTTTYHGLMPIYHTKCFQPGECFTRGLLHYCENVSNGSFEALAIMQCEITIIDGDTRCTWRTSASAAVTPAHGQRV